MVNFTLKVTNGDDVCHTVVILLSYRFHTVVTWLKYSCHTSDVNSGSGGVFRTELRISSTPQSGDSSQTFTDRLKTKRIKKQTINNKSRTKNISRGDTNFLKEPKY